MPDKRGVRKFVRKSKTQECIYTALPLEKRGFAFVLKSGSLLGAPESYFGGRSITFPDGKSISDRESPYYQNMNNIYLDTVKKYESLIMSPQNRKKIEQGLDAYPNCGAGWKTIAIHADGDVIPCGVMNKAFVLGNIHEASIQEIFKTNPISGLLSKVELKINRQECFDCEFKSFCAKCIYIK